MRCTRWGSNDATTLLHEHTTIGTRRTRRQKSRYRALNIVAARKLEARAPRRRHGKSYLLQSSGRPLPSETIPFSRKIPFWSRALPAGLDDVRYVARSTLALACATQSPGRDGVSL